MFKDNVETFNVRTILKSQLVVVKLQGVCYSLIDTLLLGSLAKRILTHNSN